MSTVSFPSPVVHNDYSDDVDQSCPSHPYAATGLDDQALADAAADLAYENWLAEAGELPVEDAPCSCCGSRADVMPIVDSELSVCRACVERYAEGRGAEVVTFIGQQDLSPVPCPHCGWGRTCRNVGQLAQHLATFHKLSDDHAVSVVVHAVEFRQQPVAA